MNLYSLGDGTENENLYKISKGITARHLLDVIPAWNNSTAARFKFGTY